MKVPHRRMTHTNLLVWPKQMDVDDGFTRRKRKKLNESVAEDDKRVSKRRRTKTTAQEAEAGQEEERAHPNTRKRRRVPEADAEEAEASVDLSASQRMATRAHPNGTPARSVRKRRKKKQTSLAAHENVHAMIPDAGKEAPEQMEEEQEAEQRARRKRKMSISELDPLPGQVQNVNTQLSDAEPHL